MLELLLHFKNISQSELARKLGIKRQNVYLWINERQDIPKKHVKELSRILGIKEETLSQDYNINDIKSIKITLKDDNEIDLKF